MKVEVIGAARQGVRRFEMGAGGLTHRTLVEPVGRLSISSA